MKLIRISYTDKTDEQLMRLSSRGGRKAFETLYDRYFARLVWFARQFVSDEQKAEDVVQEIFVRIIEKPDQFDQSRKFSTWIYTVTANMCRNVLRNEQNRSRLLEENGNRNEQLVENGHLTDHKLLKEELKKIYRDLSPKEKQIFVLRFEHGINIKEIAVIMEIPEGSVKSGIYYLLKKVSSGLKEFDYGK